MAGETTGSPAANPPVGLPTGLFVVPLSATYGSTENELNDVKQMGYIPADVQVLGFLYKPSDMDTNVSPLVVHKITVGSTDLATGLTGAQSGAGSFVPCTPTRFTTKSLVTVTSTTAAATGASGTLSLGVLCQK
jgi:VIT1/CCC1 family predicted Fe2+/Mn2+ transporter